MSERSSFYRKVMYGGIIVLLLFPLAWLSMPATVTEAGGKLAQMRSEHRLSQRISARSIPASETIKLATLGLRGVAVNLLWEKANYYKKTEDWTNLTATLEQLAKLQPNFITFWKFQAWNLTLQRVGRIRRLSRSLLLRAPRHRVPHGRRATTTPTTRTCCGTSAGSSARRSAGPTSTCNIASCSRPTTISIRPRSPARSARQLARRQGVLFEGRRCGRQQGPQHGPQEPAHFLFQPGDVADELRGSDRGRRLLRQSPSRLDQGPGRMGTLWADW